MKPLHCQLFWFSVDKYLNKKVLCEIGKKHIHLIASWKLENGMTFNNNYWDCMRNTYMHTQWIICTKFNFSGIVLFIQWNHFHTFYFFQSSCHWIMRSKLSKWPMFHLENLENTSIMFHINHQPQSEYCKKM